MANIGTERLLEIPAGLRPERHFPSAQLKRE
jgi:hypothetical protein